MRDRAVEGEQDHTAQRYLEDGERGEDDDGCGDACQNQTFAELEASVTEVRQREALVAPHGKIPSAAALMSVGRVEAPAHRASLAHLEGGEATRSRSASTSSPRRPLPR